MNERLKRRLQRARRYELLLYRVRERYDFYHAAGTAGKASRVISKCKLLATPLWDYRQKQRKLVPA